MLEKYKQLSKNAKAEADAIRYQLKRDEIRKKSNEYYRRRKAELSEAAALDLKRKKAIYDSQRYQSKRDEINNKSKERYRKKKEESDRATFKDFGKRVYYPRPSHSHFDNCCCTNCVQRNVSLYYREKPKPIYYEKNMTIDGDPSKLQAAIAQSIVIRDPSQLKAPDLPTNVIEICVDFRCSWNNDKSRSSVFTGTLETVLLGITSIMRNHLRSTFTNPIECEYILMRIFGTHIQLKPEAERTGSNINADCNRITTHFSKEWFKSLGFHGNKTCDHLNRYIWGRLNHVYGIGGCDWGGTELVFEHAAKLDLLNDEISEYLQTLFLNEVKSLQDYFYSCISGDDTTIKRIGSSILMYVFLKEMKAAILKCGFREIHYQHVLEEWRQTLQSLGIFSWRIGKHVIEHQNFKLRIGLSDFLVPQVVKMDDWRTGDHYYLLCHNKHWDGIDSKLRGKGKMIVYRGNVFTVKNK